MFFQEYGGDRQLSHAGDPIPANPVENQNRSVSVLDAVMSSPMIGDALSGNAQGISQGSGDCSAQKFQSDLYQRLPMDLLVKWPDTIISNTTINCLQGVFLEPVSSMNRFRNSQGWILLNGKFGGEAFAVAFEAGICSRWLQQSDLDLPELPQHPKDATLVLEYLFTGVFEQIQHATGKPLELVSVQQMQELPNHGWLCVEAEIEGISSDVGLAFGPGAAELMGRFVDANSFPNEKQISDTLAVKVGPITLPYLDSHKIASGDVIDSGINPNGEVYGILERSDRRYWPIMIDDDVVTLLDFLQEPASTMAGKGSVLASLQIGTVTLAASQRVRVRKADRLIMERTQNNGASLFLGVREHGHGTLDVNEGTLVISMEQVGKVQ